MRALFALAAAAALGALSPIAHAAPTIALPTNDAPQSFTIPGGSSTDSFYIDVGADANRLEIHLDAQQPSTGDIDLLLRYDTPFPDPGTGLPPDVGFIYDTAQYHSSSLTGNEFLIIGKSNVYPVKAGRWFVTVINFENSPVTATLRARTSADLPDTLPIQVVFNDSGDGCNIAPWTDGTARTPVGNNTGTTLGAQRVNALMEAARLLGSQLKSPVPIRVQACWDTLPGGGGSVTLAQAGPRDYLINEKYLPRNQTIFVATPATKLGGTGSCGLLGGPCDATSYELRATFNSQVDTPAALGNAGFYYGFLADTNPASNDVDFISVAMHEITHGLGFIALVNVDSDNGPVGEKPDGLDDIYDANVVFAHDDGTFQRFTEISDGQRAAAMTSNIFLRWDDPATIASSRNLFRDSPPPDNFVRLYSPPSIEPGSTLSHLAQLYPNEIMRASAAGAQRSLGLAAPMLNAIGWSDAERAPKVAIVPPSGLYFDPSHPGHGIGFTRVADNVYFLAFYTYDDNGAPEWYIAIGPVVDGVFTPAQNANGDSLVKYKYVSGAPTPQQPDSSMRGQIRLDFNEAGFAPACNDGATHDKSGALGVMSFSIAPRTGHATPLSWCMQPLIPASLATTPDFTGTWYGGPTDSGWGFSLASFSGSPKSLFGVLYYPDANGNGRWGYLISDHFANGAQMNLVERHGYCRTCAVPAAVLAGQFDDRNAGTIMLNLNQAVQNQSAGNGTFSVTYQLAPGGTFARPTFPMTLLSVPPGL